MFLGSLGKNYVLKTWKRVKD